MQDRDCVQFLQWVLPLLNMSWRGFRRVRGQVCGRLSKRLMELGMAGLSDYRLYLQSHAQEWKVLDSFCRITISSFYRDPHVFELLATTLLPERGRQALADSRPALQAWSAGCGSGEEPYTLSIIWQEIVQPLLPGALPLLILASDVDAHVLGRAARACYQPGSVKHLPEKLLHSSFEHPSDREFCVKNGYRAGISFTRMDVRRELPTGPFDVILCRNLVFTYFALDLQRELLDQMAARLRPGGIFLIGAHERLPSPHPGLQRHHAAKEIFCKVL